MSEFWRHFFLAAVPAALPGLTYLLVVSVLLHRKSQTAKPLTEEEEKELLRLLTRKPIKFPLAKD
jgi:hypothetical protein